MHTTTRLECPGKSNLSSVCLLICRVFGLAGKHDRPTDLDMLTFEQIWLFSACGRPGTKFYVGSASGDLNPLSPPRTRKFPMIPPSTPKFNRQKKDDRWADRQMTDLIFPGHKSRKNAKSAKIKSAVRKTEKHDRSADRQMTDLIFWDTLLHIFHTVTGYVWCTQTSKIIPYHA